MKKNFKKNLLNHLEFRIIIFLQLNKLFLNFNVTSRIEMAEAHQGVAFAFIVTEEDGLHLSVSLDTFKAVMLSGVRSWRRKTVFFLVS